MNIERLCIIDEIEAHELFFECSVRKDVLEEWGVNWQGSALGNFAKALLNVIRDRQDNHTVMLSDGSAQHCRHLNNTKKNSSQQMCQVNVRGKVVARGFVDPETGKGVGTLHY